MGLTGCYTVLKILVVFINFIFGVLGAGVIVLSVFMLTDPTYYVSVSMTQDETNYYTGIYIFLAAGVLMFIVGFLGCCGAIRESPCLLVSFFCFLLIIVVAEIAAAAWAYNNADSLEGYVRESVKTTVQQEYGYVNTRTNTFDSIQEGLHCCGANGPKDWSGSKFSMGEKSALDMTVSSLVQNYRIPESCCRDGIDKDLCRSTLNIGIAAHVPNLVYSEGCIDKLIDMLKSHIMIMIGIVVGIGIIELLGMIFSLVLCCGIRNMDRYKA